MSGIARPASAGGFTSVGESSQLDEVNLLLDVETHSMMGSMMLGHGDAGFLLDDAGGAGSQLPVGGGGGGGGTAECGSVVEEVFREEVYEQQVCVRERERVELRWAHTGGGKAPAFKPPLNATR